MAEQDDKKQFNVYLPESLIKRVKHAAIEAEQRLSDFVADALEAFLKEGDQQ
jgi:metal-responsive CopG/Arc/MetJ family transcriptional regulator